MFEALLFFVFAVIIGLMFLFFGYPFFRILLPIWGFFAGLSFGVQGMESIIGNQFVAVSLGLVIGLVFGIVLALLAYFMYSLAVYLFGITVGYVLGSGIVLSLGFNQGMLSAIVGIVVAIAFAVLFMTIKMPKYLIVFLTAGAGAMGVIMGLFVLFGRIPAVSDSLALTSYFVTGSWFWLIIWVFLVAIGVLFQYALLRLAQDMSDADLNETYNWKKEYVAL